jgi:RIO-like serine/threonine protein kinase
MSLLGTPAVVELSKLNRHNVREVIDSIIRDMADIFDRHTVHGSIVFPLKIIVGRAQF